MKDRPRRPFILFPRRHIQRPRLRRHARPGEQLLRGHEAIPLLRQRVHRAQHGLHRGRVRVVQQHDVAGLHALHDRAVHRLRIPPLPVLGVQRPVQHRHLHRRRDLLAKKAPRRPHPVRPLAQKLPQPRLRPRQLRQRRLRRRGVQPCVGPRVAAHLVPLAHHAPQRLLHPVDLRPDHEKGRLRAPLGQPVQQQLRRLRPRPVVKGEGHALFALRRRAHARQRQQRQHHQAQKSPSPFHSPASRASVCAAARLYDA